MAQHCLDLDALTVIIVGDGTIGTALMTALLARPQVERVFVLGRKPRARHPDDRVYHLTFDATQPESITAAAAAAREHAERAHLLINTVGMLHSEQQQPEKRLRSLEPASLLRSFTVNAALLPQLAMAFGPLLRHDEPALLASLSARVGSIEDNQMGGWYSYRASKAAHNMLLKTIALEWKISQRNTAVVALHPGTVTSPLSEPFLTSTYKNRVLTPAECAEALLTVIGRLEAGNSGQFYDWQGQPIPW